MSEVTIHVRISPAVMRWGLASGLLSFMAVELASENVTLTTYYPAPSGIYAKMITTNNTFLARDSGNVGIGTTAPTAKLEVTGTGATGGIAINNSGTPFIDFKSGAGVTGRIEGVGSAMRFYINGAASGNERLRIDSNGRISMASYGNTPSIPAGLTNMTLIVTGGIKAYAASCGSANVQNYPGNAISNCPAGTYATNATGFWAEYISMGGPTLETSAALAPAPATSVGVGVGQMYCCPCGGGDCNP